MPINTHLEFLPCISSIPGKCMSVRWDVLYIRFWGVSVKLCTLLIKCCSHLHCAQTYTMTLAAFNSQAALAAGMFHLWSCHSCSLLTLVMIDRDAPWSKRTEATSSCPSRAERCRGVYPDVVAALGDAPCCSSCCTMSAFPRRAEMCSGVWSS